MRDALMMLLRSRKFLIAVFDAVVVGVLIYFSSKYGSANLAEDIQYLVTILQPVVLMIIGSIAYEDGQAKRGGNF